MNAIAHTQNACFGSCVARRSIFTHTQNACFEGSTTRFFTHTHPPVPPPSTGTPEGVPCMVLVCVCFFGRRLPMTTADRIAELERRAEALRAELRQAEAAAMLCRARVEGIEVEIEWLRRGEAHA